MNTKTSIFAVDIGGSKLICGILSREGRILQSHRSTYPTGYSVNDLLALIEKEYYELGADQCCSVCAATVPGLCDITTGTWLYSPFSGIENIQITEHLTKITGLPSCADNDVNLSALAERYFGACQNCNDFLWITISNGIGGGLFLNGDLYRGEHLTAGEIGHVIVEESGRLCGCGKHGCLEAMASGASLSAIYEEMYHKKMGTKDIATLAFQGDKNAISLFQQAGFYIGKAAAHTINLLGLRTVVLGGGMSESFSLLQTGIQDALDRCVFKQANPTVNVIPSPLGSYAALKGCAALVLDQEKRRTRS